MGYIRIFKYTNIRYLPHSTSTPLHLNNLNPPPTILPQPIHNPPTLPHIPPLSPTIRIFHYTTLYPLLFYTYDYRGYSYSPSPYSHSIPILILLYTTAIKTLLNGLSHHIVGIPYIKYSTTGIVQCSPVE